MPGSGGRKKSAGSSFNESPFQPTKPFLGYVHAVVLSQWPHNGLFMSCSRYIIIHLTLVKKLLAVVEDESRLREEARILNHVVKIHVITRD